MIPEWDNRELIVNREYLLQDPGWDVYWHMKYPGVWSLYLFVTSFL